MNCLFLKLAPKIEAISQLVSIAFSLTLKGITHLWRRVGWERSSSSKQRRHEQCSSTIWRVWWMGAAVRRWAISCCRRRSRTCRLGWVVVPRMAAQQRPDTVRQVCRAALRPGVIISMALPAASRDNKNNNSNSNMTMGLEDSKRASSITVGMVMVLARILRALLKWKPIWTTRIHSIWALIVVAVVVVVVANTGERWITTRTGVVMSVLWWLAVFIIDCFVVITTALNREPAQMRPTFDLSDWITLNTYTLL